MQVAPRNRKMRRGRGQRNYNYGYNNRNSYQEPNNAQIPWQNTNTNSQLNEMELELEMMKRKRQMLQEQRQLLEEQRQLEQLQNQGTNMWSDTREYDNRQLQQNYDQGYGNVAQGNARRGTKRPANSQPSIVKQGGATGPRQKRYRKAPRIESQAAFDVGPIEAPPGPAVGGSVVFSGTDGASRSTLGKLELCLGRVVREMRDTYCVPPHGVVLHNQQSKVLKERVRQRIHALMLNKPVTTPDVIYETYRKVYPTRSDLRLLETIKEMKMGDLEAPVTPTAAPVPVPAQPAPADKTPARNRRQRQSGRERQPLDPEQEEILRETKKRIHVMLEEKLDTVFNKLHKICMEEAGPLEDAEQTPVAEAPEAGEEQPSETAVTPAVESADAVKVESAEANGEEAVEVKSEPVATEGEPIKKEGTEPGPEAEEKAKDEAEDKKIAFIEKLMDRIMRQKIPTMLPRYRHHMLSILSRDKQFRDIGLTATDKLPELHKSKIYSQIYYVKICGRPTLPPRQVMQPFLDQFECVSVKKHKSIYNLLFVGVATPENHKKLLESDGVTIGGKLLEIRSSERQKQNAQSAAEGAAEPAVTQTETVDLTNGAEGATEVVDEAQPNVAKETAINNAVTDMDSEINDLLSCINDGESDPAVEQDTVVPEQVEAAPEQDTVPKGEAQTEEPGEHEAVAGEEVTAGIRTRRSSRVPQKN